MEHNQKIALIAIIIILCMMTCYKPIKEKLTSLSPPNQSQKPCTQPEQKPIQLPDDTFVNDVDELINNIYFLQLSS